MKVFQILDAEARVDHEGSTFTLKIPRLWDLSEVAMALGVDEVTVDVAIEQDDLRRLWSDGERILIEGGGVKYLLKKVRTVCAERLLIDRLDHYDDEGMRR